MLTVRTSENTVITSFRLISERQDFSSVRTGENTVRARARIQAEDFIGESPLYKKAVVNYCMINVADSVANVLTGWNQGPHNYMEDLLDLPEE